MPAYGYALGDADVQTFTALPARQRHKLLHAFAGVARSPGQTGDYREPGGSGRTYGLKRVGEVLLAWWTDHSAQEVLIVRIEIID